MQVVELQLSDELLQRLDDRAREVGDKDRAAYIRGLIEKDVEGQSTLEGILRPYREQVKKSAITNEELNSLFAEAREETWQEKQVTQHRGE